MDLIIWIRQVLFFEVHLSFTTNERVDNFIFSSSCSSKTFSLSSRVNVILLDIIKSLNTQREKNDMHFNVNTHCFIKITTENLTIKSNSTEIKYETGHLLSCETTPAFHRVSVLQPISKEWTIAVLPRASWTCFLVRSGIPKIAHAKVSNTTLWLKSGLSDRDIGNRDALMERKLAMTL